jgi:hypothetical protein
MEESIHRLTHWMLPITASLAIAACDTPPWTLIDPQQSDENSRILTVKVGLEDSVLAAALGWADGVPAAQLSLHRIHDEFSIRTAVTDSTGSVRLNNMLAGRYRIAAYRVLAEDETGPTGGLVRAFGAGMIVRADTMVELDMKLRIDRAGSLVVSEIRPGFARYSGSDWPTYQWFGYFRIHNNADTTVYLDGMLWGQTFQFNNDSQFYPCTETQQFRNDPLGVWVRLFHRFPGAGSEYPVAPGQSVTVALDAVDHSVVDPSLPDLSHADFELVREADTDNPDVPNMPWAGADHPAHTHGLAIRCSDACFLGRAVDVESLPHARYPLGSTREWMRIPTEAVIDVVSTDDWIPSMDQFVPCNEKIPNATDALEVPTLNIWYDATLSLRRKVLRLTPSGLPVFQDLNVSFLDFAEAPRGPDSVER